MNTIDTTTGTTRTLQKKLYSIYGWELPHPISLRTLGLVGVGAVIALPVTVAALRR